jgi:hypothetical protein
MVRVLKIEQQGNREVRRTMQFSDQMWEEIRKLKLGGVTWELLPTKEPQKIIVPSSMPPEPVIVPEVIEYNKVIPAKEEVVIPTKKEAVKKPKKEKNETPTVQKKRATNKRSKGNAKK